MRVLCANAFAANRAALEIRGSEHGGRVTLRAIPALVIPCPTT
jgi:hypothetical protein